MSNAREPIFTALIPPKQAAPVEAEIREPEDIGRAGSFHFSSAVPASAACDKTERAFRLRFWAARCWTLSENCGRFYRSIRCPSRAADHPSGLPRLGRKTTMSNESNKENIARLKCSLALCVHALIQDSWSVTCRTSASRFVRSRSPLWSNSRNMGRFSARTSALSLSRSAA